MSIGSSRGRLVKIFWAVVRLGVLLLSATVGGAALVISIPAYYVTVIKNRPDKILDLNFDEYGIFLSLIFMGIFTGTLGWGYLHVLLAYNLVLRRIPNFWPAMPLYFSLLFLGTFLIAILIMHLSSGENPILEALLLGVPVGFWGTMFCVWKWHRRALISSTNMVQHPLNKS